MAHIEHIDPDGLSKNAAFSQIVVTHGTGKTIYIGGQNAVNAHRETVGKGDIGVQTEQVMRNIQTALSACNADLNDLVKLTIFIVQGQDVNLAFRVSQQFMGNMGHPPAISTVLVAGLAHPDFLLEIDAIAFTGQEIGE